MKKIIMGLSVTATVMGAPLFTDSEIISHEGERASWTPSGTKSGSPAMVDWNNDGLLDVVVGYLQTPSGAGMSVSLNKGTNDNPVYADPVSSSYPITGV